MDWRNRFTLFITSLTFQMALEMIEKEGDYQVALWNGFGWNLLNLMLIGIILISTILTKFKDNELQPT